MITILKRQDLKGLYISASHIGAIVKHYKEYKFQSFNDIDFIASRTKWSAEEKHLYSQEENKIKGFIFNKGKVFEQGVKKQLQEIYKELEFTDWNESGTGLFHNELKLYAIPDFLFKQKDESYLIECKSSLSTTKNFDNYLYQLALQDLLLELPNCVCSLYFKDKEINIKRVVIDQKKQEIVECIALFWQDLESNKFKLITAEEAIKKYLRKKQPDFIESDFEVLEMIEKVASYSEQEKEIKSIKEKLYNKYSQYSSVSCPCLSEDIFNISIIKPTTTLLNKEYFEKELDKLEEKYLSDKEKLTNQIKEFKNKSEEKVLRSGYIKITLDN